MYNIYINDDGLGIPPNKLEELNNILNKNAEVDMISATKKLIGICNVNSRIKLYFGNDYGISISSFVNKGTTVHITLPVTDMTKGADSNKNISS